MYSYAPFLEYAPAPLWMRYTFISIWHSVVGKIVTQSSTLDDLKAFNPLTPGVYKKVIHT